MKSLFHGYYRPSEDDFREIWQSAIFVIDANILLNMYRYPVEARQELLGVLQSINTRLWVPYQAALEFQINRVSVIVEQNKRFSKVQDLLNGNKQKILSGLEELQLTKKHFSSQVNNFVDTIKKEIEAFLSNLKKLDENQLSLSDHDYIREELDQLLQGKVGDPFSQEEIDKIYKEGEARFKNKIPPGYKDSSKETENRSDIFSYGGITYHRKYGDLVIWKQIIKKAQKDSIKSVIFLTDDQKEDWWWINSSHGTQRIGPRPELIGEIHAEAETKFFYIYSTEQFLKFSKDYLDTDVAEESISQIHEVSREVNLPIQQRGINYQFFNTIAEQAVFKWLQQQYPDLSIRSDFTPPDYKVFNQDTGLSLGFEVIAVQTIQEFKRKVWEWADRFRYRLDNYEEHFDQVSLVFVIADGHTLFEAIQFLDRRPDLSLGNINLILGNTYTENDEDSAIYFHPVFFR
ncbi:PIN-like domain-containing protein [Synechococcus elongatus]|uniref:PIN-like domain-containing protein n=1 Tax=Synechococcus elongatus TaxID=32046 RepID=UPI000F7DA626|nr:PIN-like domain-containing protein [Synechococcus elongatus]